MLFNNPNAVPDQGLGAAGVGSPISTQQQEDGPFFMEDIFLGHNFVPEWMNLAEASKILKHKNVGRTNLYKFLEEERLISRNELTIRCKEQGLFRLASAKHKTWSGCLAETSVLLISRKGLRVVRALLKTKYPNGFPRRKRKYNDGSWE